MLLVNHSVKTQENVWNFANNFDITHKIWIELNQYKKDDKLFKPNSLLNAIYIDKTKLNREISRPDAEIFQDGLQLFDKHFNETVKFLNLISMKYNLTDEINSLDSILNLMKVNLELIICK